MQPERAKNKLCAVAKVSFLSIFTIVRMMNLQGFLKTLKNYGYNSQYTAQILNALLRAYTDYTVSGKITPTKDTSLLAAFRLTSSKNGNFTLTTEGLKIAKELTAKRACAIAEEVRKPDIFFVLKFVQPQLEEPEIQFLLSATELGDIYRKTMNFLEKSGLAYYNKKEFRIPRNLYTFFEFPFKDEPFESTLRQIRAYIRLSPLNPRIMKVTFSDMRNCKQEVMEAVKDMRAQGIIKEFVRDKGYSFRVLDARKYQNYVQNLLTRALQGLKFVHLPSVYEHPESCGWDSVGLLDEYPVSEGVSMNILLFGDPGPLKQLWAQHFAYGELVSGKGAIYLSITSPPEDIRKNFSRFKKDVTTYEREGKFIFVDCYPRRQKSQERIASPIDTSSLTDFGTALSEASEEIGREPGVLVFDSLSNLMLYFDPEQVIKFAVNQASKLKEWGWTGIFIVEKGVNDEKIENSLKFLLDGVFEIYQHEFHIQWIRGMVDKPVTYVLDISERGLVLLPKRSYHE